MKVQLSTQALRLQEKESQLEQASQDIIKAKEDNLKLQTQYYQDKQDKEALHMEVDSLREKLAYASDANTGITTHLQPVSSYASNEDDG